MATNIDQPGDKLKRTIAAAIAAVTAGASMWLAASAAGPDEQGQEPAHQAHRKDKTGEIHNRAALRGQAPGARLRRREIGQDLHGPRRFPAAGPALPAGPFHARCDRVRRAAARGRAPQEEEGALARAASSPPR